jgi:hypothetical protein
MKKALLLGFFAALVAAFDASAQQLPRARITSIFPAGGQQGTRVDVTITGGDLDGAKQLFFSHKGITAAQKKDDKGNVVANQYTVAIAKNVTVGIYDVQVGGGQFGISNVRAFAVGDLPEEKSTAGTSADKAMEVKLGTTINGQTISRNYSYFKVTLEKGQGILVECQAADIDSKMAPVLVLKDANGLELERNRFGEPLDFTPLSDGDYFVALHDFTYGGGAEHVYRLTISQRPYIDFIIPPVGKPGSNGKYTVYGRNLPGGQDAGIALGGKPLQKKAVTIALPGDAASRLKISSSTPVGPVAAGFDGIDYRLPSPAGASNPVRIHFAESAVIAEAAADNNRPESAQKISVPCEYVGQFYPRRDRDWVTFEAKKGDIYWVEIISERLGAPTNPFFRIQRVTKDDKGVEKVSTVKEVQDSPVNIGGSTFNTSSIDPSFRFVAPDDGTYRILLYDLYSRGSADSLYRLSIHKEVPDFRLVAMPEGALAIANQPVPMPTGFLRRGQVLPIKVMAFKRDNFNEPIELSIAGLPAHLTASKATLAAGQNSALIMLSAKTNAPNWFGNITIIGKSKIADKPVTRTARNAGVSSIVYDSTSKRSNVRARLTNTLQLQVTDQETIPVAMAPKENKVYEHSVFGQLKIPFTIKQDAAFKAVDKKVKCLGHSSLSKFKDVTFAKNKDEGTLDLNLNTYKLPVGEHVLYLRTQVKGKYSRVPKAKIDAAKEEQKKADAVAVEADKVAKAATTELNTAKTVATKAATDKTTADKMVIAAKAAQATAQKAFDGATATAKASVTVAATAKVNATKIATALTTATKDATTKRTTATTTKRAHDGLITTKQKPAQTKATAAATALTKAQTDKTAADKALTTANAEVAKAKTTSDTAEVAAKAAEALSKKIAGDANKKKEEKDKVAKGAVTKRAAVTTAKKVHDDLVTTKQNPAQTKASAAATALTKEQTDKTAADKALTTVNAEVAKAKTASDTAEVAAKAAETVTATAKTTDAKAKVNQTAADKKVVDTKNATTTAKTALDKSVAATKAGEIKAAAVAKVATDTKVKQDAAQKKNDDLAAKKKATDTAKAAAAANTKKLTDTGKPKDITATFFSTPITVKVTAAPIDLKPVAASQVKQGAKVEFTVNLDRKYGFADPVTIGVALPKGTAGLSISKLTIAKDQKTGKFTITATDKATVGDLALNIEATMKLQNQTIKVTQSLKLKVIEVKKTAKK